MDNFVGEKPFKTARNDIVFKTVFIDDKDHTLMNALLSEILNTEVSVIKYLKNELDIKDVKEREKRVDALIEAEGRKIHLEINTDASETIRYRNLIYFEAWHSNETRKNEKYDPKEIYMHIDLTFGLGKKHNAIEEYQLRSKEGHLYCDNIKFIVVNMDKIKGFWYAKERKEINRYRYLTMLDLNKEELENYALKGDRIINDYKERIMDVNGQFSFRDFIPPEKDDEMLMNGLKDEYRDKGLEEGRKEGIEQNKLDTAKKMLEKNLDISLITEITGISEEDLIKLKK